MSLAVDVCVADHGDRVASVVFFFNDTATTEIYTLSLHDALPIFFADAEEVPGLAEVEDDPHVRDRFARVCDGRGQRADLHARAGRGFGGVGERARGRDVGVGLLVAGLARILGAVFVRVGEGLDRV